MKRLLFVGTFLMLTVNINAQTKQPASAKNGIGIEESIEHIPQFPGGMKAFVKFMEKNLKWPYPNQDIDISGRVIVSFVVEANGRLTDFKVERKISPECDNEALRVLKKMPHWRPKIENGKPVRCRYMLPVNFQ